MRGDKGQDEEIEGIIPDYIWKDGLCGAVYGHTGGNPVWRLPVAGRVHAHCIRISILLSAAVIIYIFNEPINSSFKMAWIVPVLVIPVFGVLLYIFVQMQFQTKLMARRLKKHRRHGCLPEAGPGSTGANQGSQQEKQPLIDT